MIVAENLRSKNRAEYLIYMWQVEDLMRAYDFDMDRISKEYLSRFQLTQDKMEATELWYADICQMMLGEGLREKGHLQINRNTLADLEEFHNRLLASDKFPYYRQMYYKVLPYIVEIRSKGGADDGCSELETCFNTLYGTLLLRLQHKDISEDTQNATRDISALLGQLSDYYLKDKQEPLEL